MWFLRGRRSEEGAAKREMPEGLWTKCEACGEIIYKRQLEEHQYTCPKCGAHFRIGPQEFVKILFDEGTFQETNTNIRSVDPLEFVDTKRYTDRLAKAYREIGHSEALMTGVGQIGGQTVVAGLMNFRFIGGSMGSVVGEKFIRAADEALRRNVPYIVVCASGGARMQESALSLMQMAKTAAKLTELAEHRIPYITVLTHPTTGGVTASYGMLGDVIIAEPGALIGFAGPRVIEQTIRRKLPPGFQRAESLLEHGFVDMIVSRRELRATLSRLLSLLQQSDEQQ